MSIFFAIEVLDTAQPPRAVQAGGGQVVVFSGNGVRADMIEGGLYRFVAYGHVTLALHRGSSPTPFGANCAARLLWKVGRSLWPMSACWSVCCGVWREACRWDRSSETG
jgi:hypothetical protein